MLLFRTGSGRGSLRAVPKLTETHLKPISFKKMSAAKMSNLVAQVLSRSVANGFLYYRTDLADTMERFRGINRK
jgi:hypothetical protein